MIIGRGTRLDATPGTGGVVGQKKEIPCDPRPLSSATRDVMRDAHNITQQRSYKVAAWQCGQPCPPLAALTSDQVRAFHFGI